MLPPSVEDCPADFDVFSAEREVKVSWTKPSFHDDHGTRVEVTSTYVTNIQTLSWDEYHVQYVGSKAVSGLSTECAFTVGVYRT